MDGWDGMDWIGLDLRVGGGIEHLTVLITEYPSPKHHFHNTDEENIVMEI